MSEQRDTRADEEARLITAALVKGRPSLSPLFESSMARILSVDKYLVAHLILFKKSFLSTDAGLNELARSLEKSKQPGGFTLTRDEIVFRKERIEHIAKGFHNAVEHAACAERLLDKLIVRRSATLHRLMRNLKTPKEEKKCVELLTDVTIKR